MPAISWLSQFQEDPDAGNAKNIISNENKLIEAKKNPKTHPGHGGGKINYQIQI